MEYCDGGDLSQVIKSTKKSKGVIHEDLIWKILAQLCMALRYCHRKTPAIIHRDIKPANVFLGDSKNVKLGDFGLSKILGTGSMYAYTNVGTPYYMSPEQVNEEKYNHKSDVWSLGCIIYEAASLRPPFHAENFLSLAIKINEGKVNRIPDIYSEDLQMVINEMLDKDPSKRPSVEDLIQKNPKVNIKVKEFKIKEWKEECLRKDKLLKEKERELIEKSKMLDKRLAAIELREQKVAELEAQYKTLVRF